MSHKASTGDPVRALPALSCDTHVHVFRPDPFRYDPARTYTPGVASVEMLQSFLGFHGLERVVVVQPSVYSTDNRCLAAALRQLGPATARGVAVIDPSSVRDEELDELHSAGVRAVRANLKTVGVEDPGAALETLETLRDRVAGFGWSLQVFMTIEMTLGLGQDLPKLDTPVILDHFAGLKTSSPACGEQVQALIDLVQSGEIYLKLSAAHRAVDYEESLDSLSAHAMALIGAAPHRMLWGSDWPHTGKSGDRSTRALTEIEPFLPVDDKHVLFELGSWADSPQVLREILVNNPARLFGF